MANHRSTATDVTFAVGLSLIVIGFGGGYEMTLWVQARAYLSMAAANGAADPAVLARGLGYSFLFFIVGVPVGLAGVVLVAVALRSYIRHGPRVATEVT